MALRETNHTKLIKEAQARAGLRGHALGEYRLIRIETGQPPVASRAAMTALCENCGAYVGIDPAPPAGASQILGGGPGNELSRPGAWK